MIKDILLSIHPKWSSKIYSGEKTIEWRKTEPKTIHSHRVYIYETSPIKAVTGYFICHRCFYCDVNKIENYPGALESGCVPLDDLKKYQGMSSAIYGWFVRDVVKFATPQPLSHYGVDRPPQSWQYVEY